MTNKEKSLSRGAGRGFQPLPTNTNTNNPKYTRKKPKGQKKAARPKNNYQLYSAAKKHLEESGLSPEEYTRACRRLAKEFGI